MQESNLIIFIILLPLMGAVVNGLTAVINARRQKELYGERVAGIIAFTMVLGSFLLSLYAIFVQMPGKESLSLIFYRWMQIPGLEIDTAFILDHLAAVMLLVVTGVSAIIHYYSIGYIHGDESSVRYFSYLNLFVFAMLLLILGDSVPVMFVGWEGVGLCSYLLIGFWYGDDAKAAAGKKAFITNRIGDFGFLLGLFLIFSIVGSLKIETINQFFHSGKAVDFRLVNIAAICLFIGATGKSAQIPLYVWLPDAMAGPTPVSALIHAATMVTAGVYMIARFSGLFLAAPIALHLVLWVGGLTALFAATIALVQNDIKKVLAYSTVSQLGFMFMAMGAGAFVIGIFHLMTHAFFKACLFLGSGSVIHAMHGEQDITKMGGLKKYTPVTYWTFLFATLAIAGFPPLAGFFSKDEILWNVFASHQGSKIVWILGVTAALCTAFYMFRLVYLTFLGESRVDEHTKKHLHESPKTMTIPLMILAGLSIVGGWIGIPELLGGNTIPNYFHHWLAPAVEKYGKIELHHYSHTTEYGLMVLSVVIALVGFALARARYHRLKTPLVDPTTYRGINKLLWNKYWIDEIYTKLIINPLVQLSDKIFLKFMDKGMIDGIADGSARTLQQAARIGSFLQTGNMQFYAFYILIGVAAIIGFVVLF